MDPALGMQLTVGALAGVSVMAIGAGLMAVSRRRREVSLAAERVVGDIDRIAEGEQEDSSQLAVAKVGKAVSAGKYSPTLRQRLARAGFHSKGAAAVYMGWKVVLFTITAVGVGGGLIFLGATMNTVAFWTIFLALSAFMAPNIAVSVIMTRRTNEIRRRLPDAVDLLEVCVSSGMGIDMAWNSVTDEIRRVSKTLADEMELTRLEIGLGVPRAEAMRHMSERTGANEISSLVALLVQSERFGASVADALSTFAKSMRELRSMRAEEAAEKMAVKLLFPMVLFIFPALLIVLTGPALMNMFDEIF